MVISPAEHDPRTIHKLLIGAIVPRPIGFVSTISPEGIPNLAPFSYFTAVCSNPPVVCFCPAVKTAPGGPKDTLRNVEATGEFVVNIVSEEITEQMNLTAMDLPPDADEFKKSGLTPVPSDLVRPFRVKESRVHMECRLLQVVPVSSKPMGGSVVLGEVVRFHVDDAIMQDFRIDPDLLRPIGRMGGPTYVRTTDRFDLARPKKDAPGKA